MKKYLFFLGLTVVFNCHAEEKIVLITDPKVLAISIHENHEPLIDLKNQKEIAYGPSPLITIGLQIMLDNFRSLSSRNLASLGELASLSGA